MSNYNPQNKQLYGKIKNLNNSIDLMLDCVRQLEQMRSHDYLAHLSDEELQVVLEKMDALEKNIEKLRSKENDDSQLIKAIGKNKKLWVTKPIERNQPKATSNTFRKPLFKTQQPDSSPFLFIKGARKVAFKSID